MNPILKNFIPVARGIAKTFGKNCEVVLHDTSDLEHSVVLIENNLITGRKVGAPMTDLGLYFLTSDLFNETDYVANYLSENKEGKKLKSTTIFIRDSNKKIIGFLCINIDIGPIMDIAKEMNDFCNIKADLYDAENCIDSGREESFSHSLDELMEQLFSKAQEKIGKKVSRMRKEDKIEMVRYLQKHGIFLVKDAIDRLAEKLNVSRFTIYNYLAEIKPENNGNKKII